MILLDDWQGVFRASSVLLQSNLRLRHMSRRTEEAYVYWSRRFVRFSGLRHPLELGSLDVRQFLSHLVEERHLSAATQQQALSAILFLYRYVLDRPLAWVSCPGGGCRPRCRWCSPGTRCRGSCGRSAVSSG